MPPARLFVNIDHLATLREARGGVEPDPVAGAAVCELAGAAGIVCHLREDRRHINDRDLRLLRELIKTELDLEMALTDEMVRIAVETLPELVTLVPEKRQELTTEGGLDVIGARSRLLEAIPEFTRQGIEVSLFVDPVREQIEAAVEVGADAIELHTGEYANARGEARKAQLDRLAAAATLGHTLGLRVNAGHGLDLGNVGPVAALPEISDLSIGHALVSRAVFVGLDRAVTDLLAAFRAARP